jgi:hypothetical protein
MTGRDKDSCSLDDAPVSPEDITMMMFRKKHGKAKNAEERGSKKCK